MNLVKIYQLYMLHVEKFVLIAKLLSVCWIIWNMALFAFRLFTGFELRRQQNQASTRDNRRFACFAIIELKVEQYQTFAKGNV